ncbi:MAG TPA: hypothetical protein VGH63_07870, partial [Polyangia bacterium]
MGFLVTVAVLVSAPPSGGAQARLDEARAAIVAAEKARGVDVVEDAWALWKAGWVAEANLAFFGEAARLVEDGKRSLARVELDRAVVAFEKAEHTFDEHRGWAGADVEQAEAAKWHGVVLFELKRHDEANEAWSRAKLLDPTCELTEAMVRPD